MIRWEQREWRLIAERLVHTHVDPNIHGWRHEVVSAMKMVLPKERWRDPTCLNNAKQILVPIMRMVVAKPPEKKELPPPQAPTAEQLSTEDLLVELARRIAKLLEPAKPNPVDRAFFPPPASQETKFEKKKKLRILVCGPNGDTSQALHQQFPSLDLRFHKYEENPAHVATRAQGVNYILCITKFMAHSAVEAVKATTISYKLVTSVREAREWLAKQAEGQ